MAELPDLMTGREQAAYVDRRDRLVAEGVPEDLASRVAVLPPAYMLLNIVEIALREDRDPIVVARVHFALGERLGLPALVQRILGLPREDRWQTMARAALRDDLHAVHAQLTAQVLATTSSDDAARRPDRRLGGRRRRRRAAGPRRRSRRSAPTSRPTWPGCRSGCGWSEGC